MTTRENSARKRSVKGDSQKLLSIVMMGRDDDYMLDFKYRISTTINHITRNLQRLDRLDVVEIIVVDWGSQVLLSQTLTLSDEAEQVCRFIYVPVEIVKAVQNGKDSFHNSKAINTGIRRATSEFVMVHAADTLIPMNSLEAILRLLNGELDLQIRTDKTYFLCNRVHAPWQFVQRQPDLDEWDRYLLLRAAWHAEATSQTLFIGAGVAGFMMHRNMWHKLRGLNERIGGWGGSDFECMNRVAQYYPWLELSSIGVVFCHMEHGPDGRRGDLQAVMEKREVQVSVSDSISVNDEGWGLADYELDIQTPGESASCSEALRVLPVSRSAKLRDESMEAIISEIKADDVRQHVAKTLLLAAKTSAVVPPEEVAAIYFISWYSLNYFPLRYLEFGANLTYTTAAAGLVNNTLEVYFVQRFVGIVRNTDNPFLIAAHLGWIGHNGYARYINGSPTTAIKRLRDSFIGEFTFDLIMVRGDVFEKDPVNHIQELIPHLRLGGALVYTRSNAEDFRDDWTNIKNSFPNFKYLQCRSASAGIILACNLKDRASIPVESLPMDIIVDLGPLRVNLLRLVCRRIVSLLADPRKYPHYLKQLKQAVYLSGIRRIIFRQFL